MMQLLSIFWMVCPEHWSPGLMSNSTALFEGQRSFPSIVVTYPSAKVLYQLIMGLAFVELFSANMFASFSLLQQFNISKVLYRE